MFLGALQRKKETLANLGVPCKNQFVPKREGCPTVREPAQRERFILATPKIERAAQGGQGSPQYAILHSAYKPLSGFRGWDEAAKP